MCCHVSITDVVLLSINTLRDNNTFRGKNIRFPGFRSTMLKPYVFILILGVGRRLKSEIWSVRSFWVWTILKMMVYMFQNQKINFENFNLQIVRFSQIVFTIILSKSKTQMNVLDPI